jgi:hypothetical protein
MTDHLTPRPTPSTSRVLRTTIRTTFVGATVLASTLLAAPAGATAPDTWDDTTNPSTAASLLTMGGWIFGVIAVITLLTYLPSMIRGSRGDGALTFSEKSEWFGGPRTGVDDEAAEPQGTGGASARW